MRYPESVPPLPWVYSGGWQHQPVVAIESLMVEYP
jgi:hypothetical protein